MSSTVKKWLAALAAMVGIAGSYGLGSADTLSKVSDALTKGSAVVEVLDPSAAPEAPAAP